MWKILMASALVFITTEVFSEKFLITCRLNRYNVDCERRSFPDSRDYTIEEMRKLHQSARQSFENSKITCRTENLSDRLERRLSTVCLTSRNITLFEYRTVWPIDPRAIIYYRKRSLSSMEVKMRTQSRVRDRNGGRMPVGKDVRYNR